MQTASSDAVESDCAICCEKRNPRKLHMLCSICDNQADKKTCLECYSKMLFNCEEINCIGLHLKCPFCRTPLTQAEICASALFGSNAYNRQAVKLHQRHLRDLVFDRQDSIGMLDHALAALTLMNNFHNNMPSRTIRRVVQRARRQHQATDAFLSQFEDYNAYKRKKKENTSK